MSVTTAATMTAMPPYPLPTAKRVVMNMDQIISDHIAVFDWPAWSAAMEPFWTPDLVYDSVLGMGNYTGLREWFGSVAATRPPTSHYCSERSSFVSRVG